MKLRRARPLNGEADNHEKGVAVAALAIIARENKPLRRAWRRRERPPRPKNITPPANSNICWRIYARAGRGVK